MGTLRRTCATAPRRGPFPKLLWANLLLHAGGVKRTAIGASSAAINKSGKSYSLLHFETLRYCC